VARSALVLLLAATAVAAQTPARRLTTIDALRQFPGYYHLQNVLLHGEFADGASPVLRAGERSIAVMLNDAKTTTGLVEVRGQLIDIGRLDPADPRLAGFTGAPSPDRWPRPGEELVVSVTSITPTQLEATASIRALALQPWRFNRQTVTVVGQFRGRNLFGDLPAAPAVSRYDFVIRSADAAIWVTALPPRGRGFDLSVDARVDTGRWLQVTGIVSIVRGLVTLDGTTVTTAVAPAVETTASEPPPPPRPLEPVEVVFSSPSDQETGVPVAGPIRVQFSKGLNPATLDGRFRVTYLGDTTPLEIRQAYDAATRSVEIRLLKPPEAFRTLRVELIEGLKSFDGAPVTAWTLTFTVGG
jgi:hypothetical protein